MADKTVKTLSIPPRVDDEAAIVLKAALIKLVNEGAGKIICNFSATEFLSQAGAEELANIARFLAKIGGELGICRIKPEVKAAILQPNLFKFYSVEESVALVALKNLVTYFEYYEDILDLNVRMENAVAHIEIYLGFDPDQPMRQVQQAVNLIRRSLKEEIKDAQVLIVPSTQLSEPPSSHFEKQTKQIVFSSQAEAARQLAQAIQQTVPEDISCASIKQASAEDGYDLVSVVFLVNQAAADAEAALYLNKLRNQKLALFAILDSYPHSGYAGECMKNVTTLLDSSNNVVGKFVCQIKDNQLSETDFMRARNKYFDILQENI